jgi:thymidylate synthase (FAD)
MTAVTPKVFFLGQPKMHLGSDDDPGVTQWLRHIGGEEALSCMEHVDGSDIERLIELLARRCYKSYAPGLNPNVTKVRKDSEQYHLNIIKSRHGSVTAHGHVHYAFEDVSRVFTHEMVRNWVGNERSQESLRYVRLTDIQFWIPPIISKETRPYRTFGPLPIGILEQENPRSVELTPKDAFEYAIYVMEWTQHFLAKYYDIDNIKDFDLKKRLTSAFRRVAPLGLATGIGMSFNLRSLRWIIEQRTSKHAEEEIRIVFGMVAEDAMRRWPKLFQDFKKVDTGDGLSEYVPEFSKI